MEQAPPPAHPLIPLKAFRPLLELLHPLNAEEAETLRVNTKLLDPSDNEIPLEQFCCFASAVESLAYRRNEETGAAAVRIIWRIIQEHGSNPDADPARVPAGGPTRGPMKSTSIQINEPNNEP